MSEAVREMTFEEEAKFYEEEAKAEFAKETEGCECSRVNCILRRGMRIIHKARKEIERLCSVVDKTDAAYFQKVDEVDRAKAKAIKEFADLVKKELLLLRKECRKELDNDGVFAIDRARKKVDNLVKEKVGDV